jgi:uncharacterized membrane protein YgdD (TMEM256/DUF423 family)
MRLRMRPWLVIAAINGALAVALGAIAVHMLAARLDAQTMSLFELASRYHMYHALALGLAAFAIQEGAAGWAKCAAWAFLIGIVLFSGSFYLYAFTGMNWLFHLAPFGGGAFIAGWVLLALAGFKVRT